VVESKERKQQLVSRLSQLPHVHASILSVDELDSHPQASSSIGGSQPIQAPLEVPLEVHSIEAQASPLEQYLRERKLSIDVLASISHSLLDGGLKIQRAEVHFSELQPRFQRASQLSIDSQNQLAAISRIYLHTMESGLDANQEILLSLGLDSPSQVPSAAADSADGDMDQQVRHYQELCRELIANGTEHSRPAAAIAGELTHAGARIRVQLAQMSATVPTAHD
jgi:hypothetical protein